MSAKTQGKRVLIINYYWPPSGGVGVLRTLKFAKELRKFGWEPVIFTAKGAHYPSYDPSLEADIPADITVLRRPILEPNALYARLLGRKGTEKPKDILYIPDQNPSKMQQWAVWLRANFFVPDARCLWISPSVRWLRRYLKKEPVAAILSSGPPHTNTRIAYLLHRATGIPWVADWRDPWTQADYFQQLPLTTWGAAKHRRQEQAALQTASRTLIVSKRWAEDLKVIDAPRVHVLTNGYDPDDFRDMLLPPPTPYFTITHLGIMGPDRHPHALLAAAAALSAELPAFKSLFRLQLIGQVDEALIDTAAALGLEKANIELIAQLPRREALGYAAASSANLLLLNDQANAAGRIPFKLFEYIALGRPILGFGPAESDVNDILAELGAPPLFSLADLRGTKQYLKQLFEQFQSAQGIPALALSATAAYSFEAITQQLAAHLDAVTMLPTKPLQGG